MLLMLLMMMTDSKHQRLLASLCRRHQARERRARERRAQSTVKALLEDTVRLIQARLMRTGLIMTDWQRLNTKSTWRGKRSSRPQLHWQNVMLIMPSSCPCLMLLASSFQRSMTTTGGHTTAPSIHRSMRTKRKFVRMRQRCVVREMHTMLLTCSSACTTREWPPL